MEYKGVWLAPGSRALELLLGKKFKELDQHLKILAQQERDLIKRYSEGGSDEQVPQVRK